MPEVVAPAPQRIGENTTNMQQNVASFEDQAQRDRSSQQYAGNQGQYQQHGNGQPPPGGWQQQAQPQQPQYKNQQPQQTQYNTATPTSVYNSPSLPQSSSFNGLSEVPNFSPFPPLRNPGPNIPPTDEQKEMVLENAREAVLACNDPDQQLTWAQDALAYCETAMQYEARISRSQPARPRTPRIEHVLREDAMKVVNFLADQYHPKAQFMRGTWYEFSRFGYPLDKPESYQCYKRAADRGYARAWYRIGMQFETGNDPFSAIKYYRRAADAGDSASCYRLGMMTLQGQHGQEQNYEEGLNLIYAAAHTADDNAPQGAYVLGMLQLGELSQVSVPEQYLPRNVQLAKGNIERAAFLGFAKAQLRMGKAYELGDLGCPFDPALSLHYNALAAKQGEVEAEMAISKWFLCGYEGIFEKNEELAFTYAQRAALDGFDVAQFGIGYFYEVGIYTKVDLKEAKEWYRKAAEQGNTDAKKRIEAVSRSKTISRKEHDKVYVKELQKQHGHGRQEPAMPSLPEIPAATLDMPDPGRLNLHDQSPAHRPTSTAPYPAGPSLSPKISQADFRPTSAFGINPNLRPLSAATMPIQTQDHYQDPYRGPSPSQGRPYPTQYPQDNYGRRPSGQGSGALTPQGRFPPQGRPPSASPHVSPNIPPQHSPRPGPLGQTNSAPNVNLGFTAPIDSQGADRPNWAPKASGNGEGPRPPPQHGRPGLPSQQGRPPPQNQGYQPGPGRAQQQTPQPRPPPKQQGQGQPSGRPPMSNGPGIQPANVRPSKPNAAAPPDQAAPMSPQRVSASQAATRPPGKGPKTFDEMGIAATKEDKDCVSDFSHVSPRCANTLPDCDVIYLE